jgi:hypothetical protein
VFVGRRAAADHLVGVVPGEQRLQRLVESSGCESASSTRAMTILSSERAIASLSGCLLWPIRGSCSYYSRSKSLYDSRRQLRIAEGWLAA